MKQKYLAATIASILTGSVAYSPLAFSAVELGADMVSTDGYNQTASVWASELIIDDSSDVLAGYDAGVADAAGSNDILNIDIPVGFGFQSVTTRYIRLELDNGAKFKAAPTCDVSGLSTGGVTNATDASVTCSIRSGATNSSFVTYRFDVKAGSVGSNDKIQFKLTTYDATTNSTGTKGTITPSNNERISVLYTLHNNDVSADKAGTSGTGILAGATLSSPYIEFVPFIDTNFYETDTLTAEVGDDFLLFTDGKTAGAIGQVHIDLKPDSSSNASYPDVADKYFTNSFGGTNGVVDGNKVVSGEDIVESASLTVTGDFTALQDYVGTEVTGTYTGALERIFLLSSTNDSYDCGDAATKIAATSVSASEAVFQDIAADEGYYTICIKPNGVSEIPESEYSASISFVSNDNYNVPSVASNGTIGKIVQNGTVLDTPYFTTNPGYISRVVFANTGNKDAVYTATVVTDDGNSASLGTAVTGTIPANANLVVNMSNIASFSGKTRGAVRFVIGAANEEIQAVYQTVNLLSGDAQSVSLNRRNGGDGQVVE